MILVNKFAYWFQQPDRGDIAVFKVPDRPTRGQPYDPTKPVYIKRVIGLPGETVEISGVAGYARREPGDPGRRTPPGHEGIEWAIQTNPLRIDGEPLVGEPYDHIHYLPSMSVGPGKPTQGGDPQILQVGPDEIYMLGDNQRSSSDSRYWGGVPVNHMRGKAILRYWPWRAVGFLPREG
jgi:signal peptidase I